MIPLARPRFLPADLEALSSVLDSGMLVQGERVAAFEVGLAARVGRRFAIAVSSGTDALELALAALDVGEGDDVLCPALTWPSPAHAILRRGARVALVDVDPDDWNGAPDLYAKLRTDCTKLAIVIDQLGNPVRRSAILAALGGLPIIEDAACGLGSRFEDAACGSFGLISTLSFHPRKILTTGEGGACLTDDPALAERLRVLRNHGQRAPGEFLEPGGNHRMTELSAALGIGQLGRLDATLRERTELSARYEAGLARLPSVRVQRVPLGCHSNRQTLGICLDSDAPDGTTVLERLRGAGVGAGRLSYDLSRIDYIGGQITPVAREIEARGLALPLFEGMSRDEVDHVLSALSDALTL